jgi:hypothetical protein
MSPFLSTHSSFSPNIALNMHRFVAAVAVMILIGLISPAHGQRLGDSSVLFLLNCPNSQPASLTRPVMHSGFAWGPSSLQGGDASTACRALQWQLLTQKYLPACVTGTAATVEARRAVNLDPVDLLRAVGLRVINSTLGGVRIRDATECIYRNLQLLAAEQNLTTNRLPAAFLTSAYVMSAPSTTSPVESFCIGIDVFGTTCTAARGSARTATGGVLGALGWLSGPTLESPLPTEDAVAGNGAVATATTTTVTDVGDTERIRRLTFNFSTFVRSLQEAEELGEVDSLDDLLGQRSGWNRLEVMSPDLREPFLAGVLYTEGSGPIATPVAAPSNATRAPNSTVASLHDPRALRHQRCNAAANARPARGR